MEEIIDWLISVEQLAGDFYEEAAKFYKDSKELKDFLVEAAEDEAWHFHVMGSAKTQFKQISGQTTPIILTDEMKAKIEAPFRETLEKMRTNTLTEEQLLDCIIETEFSEWNKIFLYVVNTLKKSIHQFEYTAAEIQRHMGRTKNMLRAFPYSAEKVDEVLSLERIFDENILIVEDDEIVAEFMQSLMEDEGNVDIAENGQVALEMLNEKYYRIVISDIDMPEMDGIELFEAALKINQRLANRFMFLSGYITPERQKLLKEHKVPFLKKPSPIEDIIACASQVMHHVN